ncbi:uncharacterized protein LOC142580177 isoform X2 [Dermacentor variabilis]|uniref:uncharacterized protein LOC142580177 isoform X2 n=1 Tax=Dermacentor variabilis TaxID=34621 RepID=UPI003F5AEC5E
MSAFRPRQRPAVFWVFGKNSVVFVRIHCRSSQSVEARPPVQSACSASGWFSIRWKHKLLKECKLHWSAQICLCCNLGMDSKPSGSLRTSANVVFSTIHCGCQISLGNVPFRVVKETVSLQVRNGILQQDSGRKRPGFKHH